MEKMMLLKNSKAGCWAVSEKNKWGPQELSPRNLMCLVIQIRLELLKPQELIHLSSKVIQSHFVVTHRRKETEGEIVPFACQDLKVALKTTKTKIFSICSFLRRRRGIFHTGKIPNQEKEKLSMEKKKYQKSAN